MNNKKAPNFFLVIIAAVVGSALFKQVDFQTFTVQKPALSALYFIVFATAIFLIVKNFRDLPKK